jgi:hypothetical protein
MAWPPVKLLDYGSRVAELERSKNPFAKVVLAHLKALETRQDPAGRRVWKFRLVRGLYERGFRKEDLQQLFRLIDWQLELPPRLQGLFEREVDEYQEERRMAFYDTWQRRGMLRIIEDSLRLKFGEEGSKLMPAIEELCDGEKYRALAGTILTADTLDEVRRACEQAAAPAPRRKRSSNAKRTAH